MDSDLKGGRSRIARENGFYTMGVEENGRLKSRVECMGFYPS